MEQDAQMRNKFPNETLKKERENRTRSKASSEGPERTK